jgi:hypothetical protein
MAAALIFLFSVELVSNMPRTYDVLVQLTVSVGGVVVSLNPSFWLGLSTIGYQFSPAWVAFTKRK